MARRIIDGGFPTSLWARRPESLDPYRDTAAALVDSLPDLGLASDILAVCVVDDAGVDQVLRGPNGALEWMNDGSIVIIHSTVHPDRCRRIQDDHPNLRVLDAPVSGGGHKAAEGELLVMAGGPRDVIDQCRPLLDTFADPLLHVGPLGSGQEAKVLNNTVFAAQLALACEVFGIAAERDLDQAAVATILSAGSGRSYAAEVAAGGGFDIDYLGPLAGELLTKDVGILVDQAGIADTVLLAAADQALGRMGFSRQSGAAG
jgi:3-hydroxyisobutyrate dehydrogenase-like beta-hydroxyacid dehydrogenase